MRARDRAVRRAHLAWHHDHVWGRLPFLVPMAARVARACGEGVACGELAALVAELRTTLLDHLDREETALARAAEGGDPGSTRVLLDALHDEHLGVAALLDRVEAAARAAPGRGTPRCAVEAAFHRELDLLAYHIRAQIVLEENVLACLVLQD